MNREKILATCITEEGMIAIKYNEVWQIKKDDLKKTIWDLARTSHHTEEN